MSCERVVTDNPFFLTNNLDIHQRLSLLGLSAVSSKSALNQMQIAKPLKDRHAHKHPY